MWMLCLTALLSALVACGYADTPANCTYDEIKGVWQFFEGERSGGKDIVCDGFKGPIVYNKTIHLLFPDIAIDEMGNKGFFTLVYNQGFEVQINYRKYFAFSKYKEDGAGNVTSYCGSVFPGWSHDVLVNNWACYYAQKISNIPKPKHSIDLPIGQTGRLVYKQNKAFIKRINSAQKSWRATAYPELDNMPISDLIRRSGGRKSRIHGSVGINKVITPHVKDLLTKVPEEFDWRNVNGVNFVSPVRNQGSCGSCFAFASMGMLEARLKIATNNTFNQTFSPQDVVSCSKYAQGCEGGFPYLIAGKYAQDFGVVPEECDPYTGRDDKCSERKCKRYYVANYYYVGGFYGGCNEDLMKLELVQNGPVAVAFEVYSDFQQYSSGIYHHTGIRDGFNPFEITNHAVLAVGYGADKTTGEKYWIVKNSWGEAWGESGYFRIRRGVDECSIESIAVSAIPIP